MSDSSPSNSAYDPQSLLQFENVFNELHAQRSAVDTRAAEEQEAILTPVRRQTDDAEAAKDKAEQSSSLNQFRWPETQVQLAEAVLEYAHDALLVLDGTTLETCNQLSEKMFGLTPADRGQDFLQVLRRRLGVSRHWLVTHIRRLRRQGWVEAEVPRGEHPSIWCEIQIRQFRNGDYQRNLMMVRDISRRKRYELELERSRDFLRNTINAVPEPLSVKSSDLEIVLVNDAFCETHDVDRQNVIGKPAKQALPRSYSAEVAQHEHHVLATGERQAAFESFVDSDHQQFILSTYRSSFSDEVTGNPYVVAVSRDVTAEMKRENRLQLLASVFENAQEGVAILNPAGEICEANPEFIATVGKAHAKILGTSLEDVVDCRPHHFTEIVSLARAGRPWFGYVKMLNKRGDEIACWLSLSPSKNRRGETTNLIAMFSDITQIEDTRRELHRQALHDNLTDLPNRRYYRQKIADMIESDDGTVRFGVCFLDLDDFKIVNDTLGHDAGDNLLVEVSRRVKEALGPDCFMARFGGDEFALLIPEERNQPLQAHSSAERVVDSLSRPFNLAGHEVHIGVSVGTTVYPDHATDVESLMRHADVAMYRAKDEGKNKVTFFSSELVEIVERRQRLLSELRIALDQHQLNVVYQPKLCLKTNRVTSSEALVRWTKPDGTVIPPSEFIPLAEDFGLITILGQQVLETVCKQARQWYDAGVLSGPIAVNLSPRQLREPNFFDQLVHTISSTGVDPGWLELEITENAVMEDVDRALTLMRKINELGVSIAMDDFGTGYSSLSYIRDFPIRTLKIDTTFVKDLPHCTRAVAIAKTVLSLGHGLDLKVVAEGVETRGQLEFLREAGCDMAQGYLVNRPIPGDEFLSWLKSLAK